MEALRKLETDEELKSLAILASEIWHEYFPCIISNEQIDYMVEKFQSYEAIQEQLKSGYEYYFITNGDDILGYMGVKEGKEDNKMFLSKFYLHKDNRGKGYASKAFRDLEKIVTQRDLKGIWLTVNKYNDNTVAAYEHMGFVKARTQVADIGNGYVMDDFIMEKTIREEINNHEN